MMLCAVPYDPSAEARDLTVIMTGGIVFLPALSKSDGRTWICDSCAIVASLFASLALPCSQLAEDRCVSTRAGFKRAVDGMGLSDELPGPPH